MIYDTDFYKYKVFLTKLIANHYSNKHLINEIKFTSKLSLTQYMS